jgi:phosphatidylglycerophosphatase A
MSGATGMPSMVPRRPTARLMLSHPAHAIALGFGSGLSPKAPGSGCRSLCARRGWRRDKLVLR